jgi:hypothetical protein
MLSLNTFCGSMSGRFVWKRICVGFFNRLITYVLPLEIQLSRRDDWGPINRFNPAPYVCLSQARTRISNVICRGLFVFSE